MVTTKHCCYGVCVNDSRYPKHDVWFIGFGNGFPKPTKDREKCLRWVNNCGRRDFTLNNVNKDTYICNQHFVGGNGPTEKNADPIKFGLTVTRPKKRKAPVDRGSSQEKKKKSKTTYTEELKSENDKIAQILLEYLGSQSQERTTETACETQSTVHEVHEDHTLNMPVKPVLVDKGTQTVEKLISENVSLAIKNKLLQKEIENLKNQLHLIQVEKGC